MQRVATGLVSVAVATAAVIGIVAFFAARDKSTTSQQTAPGTLAAPSASSALRAGNVELAYGPAAYGPRLRALAGSLGAPDTPALRRAGQALIVRRDTRQAGVLARAWRHRLTVASPADPRLQDFIEAWLGSGAHG